MKGLARFRFFLHSILLLILLTVSITLAGLCVSPVTMVIPRIVRGEDRTGAWSTGVCVGGSLVPFGCCLPLDPALLFCCTDIPALCPVAGAAGGVQVY